MKKKSVLKTRIQVPRDKGDRDEIVARDQAVLVTFRLILGSILRSILKYIHFQTFFRHFTCVLSPVRDILHTFSRSLAKILFIKSEKEVFRCTDGPHG